ncbi:MAG: hypothetical protein SPI35_03710 [Porphyromonas sp.]|nr:hypothetical protein [Porphyromonas sp.]
MKKGSLKADRTPLQKRYIKLMEPKELGEEIARLTQKSNGTGVNITQRPLG